MNKTSRTNQTFKTIKIFLIIFFSCMSGGYATELEYGKDWNVSIYNPSESKDSFTQKNWVAIERWDYLEKEVRSRMKQPWFKEGLWFRIEVEPVTSLDQPLALVFVRNIAEYAVLYDRWPLFEKSGARPEEAPNSFSFKGEVDIVDQSGNRVAPLGKTGIDLPLDDWMFRSPYPALLLPPANQESGYQTKERLRGDSGKALSWYLYVRSDLPTHYLFNIKPVTGFYTRLAHQQMLEWVYFFLFVMTLLFGGIMWKKSKDTIYLRYLAYIFSAGMTIYMGYGSAVLWLQEITGRYYIALALLWYWLAIFFTLFFASRFLRISYFMGRAEYIRYFFFLPGALALYSILFSADIGVKMGRMGLFAFSVNIYILVSACVAMKKKYTPARFYLLLWGLVVVSNIVNALYRLEVIPYSFWVLHASPLSVPLDFIFFNMLLVYKATWEEKIENYFSIDQKSLRHYKKTWLGGVDTGEVLSKLENLMEVEKVFKEIPELQVARLAGMVGIKPHQLTELVNQVIGVNFSTFVQRYRVEEAKRLMEEQVVGGREKGVRELRVLDIAFEAGFLSKSTFNKIFKQFTGLTPQEYLKNLEKDGGS